MEVSPSHSLCQQCLHHILYVSSVSITFSMSAVSPSHSLYQLCRVSVRDKDCTPPLPPSLSLSLLQHDPPAHKQVHAPPFVLSSSASIGSTGTLHGGQVHQILFSPEEAVLFCGYCVSPDQRWLLVACCDRQGELLDSTIIGIQAVSE